MIRIVHIITGLGGGGAENMLYKMLKYSDKNKYYHEVISLIDEGVFGEKIRNEGITIHSLNLNIMNAIRSLYVARKICMKFDIVNSWLYHADIFSFFVSKVFLKKKLIWNVRQSNLDKDANKSTILRIVKINSILSRYVDCITYNSSKALETHKYVGYRDDNSIVIPNGFELDKFKFDPQKRKVIRDEFSIADNERLIITVGRWDIQKDYYTLLKALKELRQQNIEWKMMMIGTNLDSSNIELEELVSKNDIKDRLLLLGRRNDIPDILSAGDIYVSSSLGESFSNAIGEAMACELPCVVTDVGDSKVIVGDYGKVINSRDYKELAKAIKSYLESTSKSRRNIGSKSRERIIENYSISSVIDKIEKVYNSV